MTNDEQSVSSESRYPVTIIFCGSNLYTSRLCDVDGYYLQNSHGKNLNVYTAELQELMINKSIILKHKVTPGYRYFITSIQQYLDFDKIRKEQWSTDIPGRCFYLYDDEDCMYCSDHFKGAILSFQ